MMNRMMGFFKSYLLGFAPSNIPPWGVARRVADGVDDVEAVTVLVVVTMDAIQEDMAERYRQIGGGWWEANHAVWDAVLGESARCLCRCVQHGQKNIESAGGGGGEEEEEEGGGEIGPRIQASHTDGEALGT
jgi:hypothetical protein